MMRAPHVANRHELVATTLDRHRGELDAFVRARVRRDDVDDVLQVAALRAIERAESLDDEDRVLAWLYRIHRNLIIDTYRQRARTPTEVDDEQIPDTADPSPADLCRCSLSQAQRLAPNYTSILTLVDTEGLELRDAARRLEISPNNAAVRLHRARRALRAAMQEHCGVTNPRDCLTCRCVEDACCAA